MKFLRKNLANIISSIRILFIPLLIFYGLHSMNNAFVALVFVMFLSDAIDGTVARKLHIGSELGRLFDTIADYIFYPTLILLIMYILKDEVVRNYWLIIIPILCFIIPKIIGVYYLKTFPHLHLRSWQILAYPFLLWVLISLYSGFNVPLLIFINIIAGFGMIEEITIFVLEKEHTDQTINSVFQVLKRRKSL